MLSIYTSALVLYSILPLKENHLLNVVITVFPVPHLRRLIESLNKSHFAMTSWEIPWEIAFPLSMKVEVGNMIVFICASLHI